MDMVKTTFAKRFEIYWVNLDPTIGEEVKKTRPCVIISPDSMNQGLNTVLIAPMTTTMKRWPFRILISHKKTEGQIMLDQIRGISKKRLTRPDGVVKSKTRDQILDALRVMFVR